jgi:hypothetical protein
MNGLLAFHTPDEAVIYFADVLNDDEAGQAMFDQLTADGLVTYHRRGVYVTIPTVMTPGVDQ